MLGFLRRFAWLLSLLWATVIMVLSVMPRSELPEIDIWEPDKIAHVIVYAVLSFLLVLSMEGQSNWLSGRYKVGLAALCLSAAYGISIEVIQGSWIPSRVFDYADILANCIGSIAGFSAYLYATRSRLIEV
jgi:VanZ family protein